jgi:hypothetical protein
MAAKKKPVKNTWTSEVAKVLVNEHFDRQRKYGQRSNELVSQIGQVYSYRLDRIQAVTALYRAGDLLLEHYVSAVEVWSKGSDIEEVQTVPERNVLNWAKALFRAETKKARDHALKMLKSSVERIG